MIKNKEVRNFFEFLISNKASSKYTKDLKEYVSDAKHNSQWRVQYMTFYANGASIELIAKSLNMTIEQVKEIVSDVEVTAC